MRARLCRHRLESASSPQSEATRIAPEACTRWKDTFLLAVHQVVTECLILRLRAMHVINCASWHTVSSADRLSQGVIAWPQGRRIPRKQVKNRQKMRKNRGGPWDPIFSPHGHPLGAPRRPRGVIRYTASTCKARCVKIWLPSNVQRGVKSQSQQGPPGFSTTSHDARRG